MTKYFNNVKTLEQLRKQYKELLKKYHPDNGGKVSDMQEINAEYDRLFKLLKDRHESKSADNKESNKKTDFNNMKYDFSEDAKLREMLNKIIHFDGITIEIIGNWLWCFNSYGYRKELKELGFKYAHNKKRGTFTLKHLERKVINHYQWKIYGTTTEVQK